MQCGPVRHVIASQATSSTRTLALRVVRRDTSFDPSTLPTEPSIQEIYGALAEDERRTEMIAHDALELAADGRSPIILTERRDHLDRLTAHLSDRGHLARLPSRRHDGEGASGRTRAALRDFW